MAGTAIYKLNASTGALITSQELEYDAGYSVKVDTTDDSVYVGTYGVIGSGLIKYNSSLEKQWTFDFWERAQSTHCIYIYGDHVYAAGTGGAWKIDKTNGDLVTYYNVYNTNPSEPSIWNYDDPAYGIAVDSNYVYLSHQLIEIDGEDRNVTIFDHSGNVVNWINARDNTADTDIDYMWSIAIESGNIYCGGRGFNKNLFKYNSDLELQWEYKTGYDVWDIKIKNSLLYTCGYLSKDEDDDTAMIRVFNLDGVKQTSINDMGNSTFGMDIDNGGNIYVGGLIYNNDAGYTQYIDTIKYDSAGNKLWSFFAGNSKLRYDSYGRDASLNSAQTYVYVTGQNYNFSNVHKHFNGIYKMRYDSSDDKFKVSDEDNTALTSHQCKTEHWGYTPRTSTTIAPVVDSYYGVEWNPSLDDFYTVRDIIELRGYKGRALCEDITKMGSNIYITDYDNDFYTYDNLIKLDLDLNYVASTETVTDGNERTYAIGNDGTHIYTGRDKCKQFNASLEFQWEFDIGSGGVIRDYYFDGTYIYFCSNRGEWEDNPSWEPEDQYGHVWKLSTDGELIWYYFLPGNASYAWAIDGDSEGNVYVAHRRLAAPNDVTLTKLDSDGVLVDRYDTGTENEPSTLFINSNDDIFLGSHFDCTDEDANVGDFRKLNTDLVNQWTIKTGTYGIHALHSDTNEYIYAGVYRVGTGKQENCYIFNVSDGSRENKENLNGVDIIHTIIIDGDHIYSCGVGGANFYIN